MLSSISSSYPIVSRVAAVVLLIAGGLKMREWVNAPASATTASASLFLPTSELIFGLWLLIGLYPRWTRIIASVCFTILLNAALVGALQGRATCGCFGKVPVQPWFAVALDILIVGAFLVSPVPQSRDTTPGAARIRWLAFAVSPFLLLVLAWPWLREAETESKTIPSPSGADSPTGIDASALERVIQAVEGNHAALHTLVYTTETFQTQHAVKWPSSIARPIWDGQKVVTGKEAAVLAAKLEQESVEKESRGSYKTWVRGEEICRYCLSHHGSGKDGDILAATKGRRIQYAPDLRQAWISTAEFVDEAYLDPVDLRCAGFQPPLRSIADWLKHCKVVNAGLVKDRKGQEVIRIHARAKQQQGKIESGVTADFLPAMNCMPIRIVYWFLPDGGVFTVTDLDYQQVGPNGAWFPRKIATRYFFRDTTSDPDVTTGQNISRQDTVKVFAVGQGVSDEDLDPILPARARLVGDLAARPWTGDVPVRVSKVTRREPLSIAPPEQSDKNERRLRQPLLWSSMALMDLLLFGACLRFRKRFAW